MEKSISISVESNNISLSKIGITMYARLDTRRPNTKDEYPIRIRIVHNRIVRDYGTKQNATKVEFEKICGERPKGNAAEKKMIILALLSRAFKIVEETTPFSFSEFNEVYLNKKNNDLHNIFNWYDDKIKELKENGQVGTAETYLGSIKSLKAFSKKEDLTFDDITPKFLKGYENWIYANKKSPTTVGIYLRPLRHIFKRAMEHKKDFISEYPFKKYTIPEPKNIKKALTREQIKSIYLHEAEEGSPTAFYRDIWLFSYFANGINMKDICKLKYKDIKGANIEFRRAKTMRTNKSTKPIVIVLTDDLHRIIKTHGTTPKTKEAFIFGFLSDKMSDEKEMLTIKQTTRQCNKYIKRIAIKLGIEAEVSTYTARHSFATILKNAGVAPSFIGESMGHANMRTTESYLGSFETEQRKDNISNLKNW